MSRQTLILDSSQIQTFEECQELHNLQYTQRLVQINQNNPELTFQVPDKMSFGTLGHKYLEIYYRTMAIEGRLAAVEKSMAFDPDKEDKIDPEFPLSSELRKKVRDRFRDYLLFYTNDYQIATKKIPSIRVCNGLPVDTLEDSPLVEQGFSYKVLDTPEYLFVLEGRIDYMGTANSEFFWMDHKWQLRKKQLYRKSIQFRNYALATNLPMGVINYVRLAAEQSKDTFVREPIAFSPAEMYEWKQELIEIYLRIAKAYSGGSLIRNRSHCQDKISGSLCQFIPICELFDSNQREAYKRLNFTQGKEWKPWV